MADNTYKKFVDDATKELKRLEKEGKRIEAAKQKYEKQGHDKRKKRYLEYKKQLKEIDAEQNKINQSLKLENAERKENDKYVRSLAKLSSTVKKELDITAKSSGLYRSISQDIVKAKAEEAVLEGEARSKAARRETLMSSILSEMELQAKAVEKARGIDEEREQFAQRKRDIAAAGNDLSDEEREKLLDAVNATEKLYNKEQRLLTLAEQRKGVYNEMPESVKSAVEFGQGLFNVMKKAGGAAASFVIIGGILAASISSFVALDKAADDFNDSTKIAISQMGEIQTQANNIVAEFKEIGLEAKDYYDIQEEIIGVLGDTARVSDSIAGSQAVLVKNFGVTSKAAAKTLQIFQSLGDVSENTAASLQLQTMELATQAGVAPAKVLEDISDSSDVIYGLFRGNTEELIKQAVEARRLGTNLGDVVKVTEQLLDFESSISKELEASTFVGGQFNLERARSLAAAGRELDAQQEILKQIQRSGDFRDKDLYTQNALAEASGMTVDEITRQLAVQDRLNSLSEEQKKLAQEALSEGLDISNLNDKQLEQEVQRLKLKKEQQGQVANLQNAFQGIVATLGSSLVPLIEGLVPVLQVLLTPVQLMAEGFKSIVGAITEYKEIFGTLVGLAGAYWTIQKGIVLWQRKEAVLRLLSIKRAAALAAISALSNPARVLAGIAAASIVTGIALKYANKADDAMFEGVGGAGYGKRALLEEGSVTLFNNRDTIVAGTNLDGGGVQSSNGTDKLLKTIERLERAYMKGVQLNIDGRNVTSRLSNVVDSSTRNNFNLA